MEETCREMMLLEMARSLAGDGQCLQTDFLCLGGAVGGFRVPSALPWWDTAPSSLQPRAWLRAGDGWGGKSPSQHRWDEQPCRRCF